MRKILLLAQSLNKINSRIPKELYHRLFRYQGFTTLPANAIGLNQFIDACHSSPLFVQSDFAVVLKHMQLELFIAECQSIYSCLNDSITVILKEQDLPLDYRKSVESLVSKETNNTMISELLFEEIKNSLSYYSSFAESENALIEANITNKEKTLNTFSKVLLLVAANIFGLLFFIVPMCYGMPMYPVIPKQLSINTPSFLVYDIESKVFKSLVKTEIDSNLKVKDALKCGCGSKDKIPNKRCLHNMRCLCFRNSVSCTNLCSCKGCANNKPPSSKERRRKRDQPILSAAPIQSTYQYVYSSNENLQASSTSPAQHFLLESCLYHMIMELEVDFNKIEDALFIVNCIDERYHIMLDLIYSFANDFDKEIIDALKLCDHKIIERWIKWRMKKETLLKKLVNKDATEQSIEE